MKRAIIILVPVVIILLTAFSLVPEMMRPVKEAPPAKKSCSGYEVIEANKGIDCNGDTIRLIKKNGFFEIAANQ